jgi:hypothetical protein
MSGLSEQNWIAAILICVRRGSCSKLVDMGMTHVRLAAANEDVIDGALRAAWKLRLEKNSQGRRKKGAQRPRA